MRPEMIPRDSTICRDVPSSRDKAEALTSLLRRNLAEVMGMTDSLEIAFSGGLDSSLLARIASEFGEVSGIVAGIEDSTDIVNARLAAHELDIELREAVLDEDDIVASASELSRITGSTDPLIISFELPIFMAMRLMRERALMTGQGADELFGGYARYISLGEIEFEAERELDLRKLLEMTVPTEDAMAVALGREMVRPYLSSDVISFALNLPTEMVIPRGNTRKLIIREALRSFGLDRVAAIDKKAAQYGSGTADVLKRRARMEKITIRELLARLDSEE